MVFIGHGTFNSNKIYFILITSLIEYSKKSAKIIAECEKKKTIVKDRYIFFSFLYFFLNKSNDSKNADTSN